MSEIKKAVQELQNENVVGMPTETVYGLAARIDSEVAIKKIFTTKERPFFDPLIVHVKDIQQAQSLTLNWNAAAQILAESFWPGPLTLVLEKNHHVSDLITSGLTTVGIRIPQHTMALELIKKVGVPLAAPSANKFGKTSPTSAEHVKKEFPYIVVLDGGSCQVGLESTILQIKNLSDSHVKLTLLRPGMISQNQIENALKKKNLNAQWVLAQSQIEAPGQMKHHYMPEIPLIIVESRNLNLEELLRLINLKLKDAPNVVEGVKIVKPTQAVKTAGELSLGRQVDVAARLLYSELRKVANEKPDCILFYKQEFHFSVDWNPVFDRLNKAATLIL